MGKCNGSGNGPCPDNRAGLGVRKHGEDWKCEKCAGIPGSLGSGNNEHEPAKDVFVNELLCFMTNYSNSIPENDIVKICVNFYDNQDIEAARRLLFDTYVGDKNKLVLRTDGENDAMNILLTMYQLITTSDEGDISKFVASDLSKIPTVTPQNVDLMTLFRDFNLMRHKVEALSRNTNEQLSKVKRDIQRIDRGLNKPTNTHPLPQQSASNIQQSATAAPTTTTTTTTVNEPTTVIPSTEDRGLWSDDDPDLDTDTGNNFPWQNVTRKPEKPPPASYASAAAKKSTRVVGTGTTRAGLSASSYEPPQSLFISFCPPATTPKQLETYIKMNVGCDAECEKLEHKYYDDFAAFKVTVRKRFIDGLRDPKLWPKDVVVDYYKPPRPRRSGNRPYTQRRGRRNQQDDDNNYYNRERRDYSNTRTNQHQGSTEYERRY